ncbi:glycosyltransferase family 9 protein [Oceanibacterium hippocampi]|uniref:ADP-heptose--LPS heptosyltransferase 2 n=1 Tax=Oceanibacterium hippocampi TaxID=745714 RepID=A0A1Y5RT32_9PROT|nr:glycosyltransferase family 9 protein [Oceanibacterium hippocampi]SLN23576.1 ADP-heptose--LPS heptosyltransferase 2 [Oceanibacterium hippocampi]
MSGRTRILVIRHGALGDVVMALWPATAIRRAHPDAHITLLTSSPYRALAERSGLFDAVWIDDRLRPWHVASHLRLARRLRQGGFARVYDLQCSGRTDFYYRFFMAGRRPEWCGTAAGASHRHDNPQRKRLHALDRFAEQLAVAGIGLGERPALAWLDDDVSALDLPSRYAALIPGAAPHRPEKRWPAPRFAELARALAKSGLATVILGASADRPLAAEIAGMVPGARDLAGRTDLFALAGILRRAAFAVGNDTGPMHLAAAVGTRSLVLFSAASDPALSAPRGAAVELLREDDLGDLDSQRVRARLSVWAP